LFSLDLDSNRWETISHDAASIEDVPTPRTDHSVVLYDGSVYVFGGYDG